jgi:hypothetical protein
MLPLAGSYPPSSPISRITVTSNSLLPGPLPPTRTGPRACRSGPGPARQRRRPRRRRTNNRPRRPRRISAAGPCPPPDPTRGNTHRGPVVARDGPGAGACRSRQGCRSPTPSLPPSNAWRNAPARWLRFSSRRRPRRTPSGRPGAPAVASRVTKSVAFSPSPGRGVGNSGVFTWSGSNDDGVVSWVIGEAALSGHLWLAARGAWVICQPAPRNVMARPPGPLGTILGRSTAAWPSREPAASQVRQADCYRPRLWPRRSRSMMRQRSSDSSGNGRATSVATTRSCRRPVRRAATPLPCPSPFGPARSAPRGSARRGFSRARWSAAPGWPAGWPGGLTFGL